MRRAVNRAEDWVGNRIKLFGWVLALTTIVLLGLTITGYVIAEAVLLVIFAVVMGFCFVTALFRPGVRTSLNKSGEFEEVLEKFSSNLERSNDEWRRALDGRLPGGQDQPLPFSE